MPAPQIDDTAITGLIDPADHVIWDAYVDRHPRGSLYHKSTWRQVIEGVFGHRSYSLGTRRANGELAGVLPLTRLKSRLFGDFLVSLPFVNYGGALGDDAAIEVGLMEAAAELARELGCGHLELRDDIARQTDWPTRTDKVEMLLDLPDDPDTLLRAIGAKARAQIRRPARERATVHRGGAELLADFYAVFARNMRDLGTPVYSRHLFTAILDAYPENAHIISVRVADRPAAAGFLLAHRDRVEIPWASSIRDYNRIGVNMLLYWEALKWAIEQGYRRFDFGRSTRDGGTYRFKAQWGARPRQLYWHYWLRGGGALPALTPSNPKYRLAIATWQRLPVPITRLLGPHLVKYLP